MLQIALQLIVAIALLVVAIRIQVSIQRRRSRGWNDILKGFRNGHGRLSDLSSSVLSEDEIECSESEIWASVNGVVGLWRIYMNMEVLLDGTDFLSREYGNTGNATERIAQFRREAMYAQLLIAQIALRATVIPVRKPPSPVISGAIRKYLASVTRFEMVLNDVQPNLLRSFKYFITRQ